MAALHLGTDQIQHAEVSVVAHGWPPLLMMIALVINTDGRSRDEWHPVVAVGSGAVWPGSSWT